MARLLVRPRSFPKKFIWGFAAAAPQIEGAAFLDGKGESIWDHYAHTPGKTLNGDTLDTACDHYTHYLHDFKLMRSLGAKNYRLSLAWPRIYPDGGCQINQKGLDFYHRLFDSLEKNEITPWVTMFHWDLPQSLEKRYGGWRDRRVADDFARYADTIVKSFGDRVKNWITLNEISCFTLHGYGLGIKAPGLKLADQTVNQTYHHALLCHGQGVRAVREFGGKGARVGLTDNSNIGIPVSETEPDIAAASAHFVQANWKVLDPIHRGSYDPAYLHAAGKNAPVFDQDDFKLISQKTDFLGMNVYTGEFVRAASDDAEFEVLEFSENFPTTDCDWHKVIPQAIYWGPRLAAEVYGAKAIYITENGCGYNEAPQIKSELQDLHRRDLLRNYLGELLRAIRDGIPVKGYFLWSFMDNFEWSEGYERRFGVVHCDFTTQQRTPKLSAKWYAKVMAENRIV